LRIRRVEIAADRSSNRTIRRETPIVFAPLHFPRRLAWMRDVDAICVEGAGKVRFVVEDAAAAARPVHSVLEVLPRWPE
jgi:hypothetical protein